MAKALRPWLKGIRGKIITYKVPITKRKTRAATKRRFLKRQTLSLKTAWNAACAEAGVTSATPKTLEAHDAYLASRAWRSLRTAADARWACTTRHDRAKLRTPFSRLSQRRCKRDRSVLHRAVQTHGRGAGRPKRETFPSDRSARLEGALNARLVIALICHRTNNNVADLASPTSDHGREPAVRLWHLRPKADKLFASGGLVCRYTCASIRAPNVLGEVAIARGKVQMR